MTDAAQPQVTLSCTHTTDGTVCTECLGKPAIPTEVYDQARLTKADRDGGAYSGIRNHTDKETYSEARECGVADAATHKAVPIAYAAGSAAALAEVEALLKRCADAIDLQIDNFARQRASGTFLGDDDHEAWTALANVSADIEDTRDAAVLAAMAKWRGLEVKP